MTEPSTTTPVAGPTEPAALPAGRDGPVAGTAARPVPGGGLAPPGPPEVRLDLSALTTMPGTLAASLAALWRVLNDRGIRLRISGAGVIPSWMLRRQLGAVVEEILDDSCRQPPAPGVASPAAVTAGKPDRDLPAELIRHLEQAATPPDLERELVQALVRCGLAEGGRLLVRQDDVLLAEQAPEVHPLAAEGWLGSLLLGADSPLAVAELDGEGLDLEEQALLRWTSADVLVPLVQAGMLQGVLLLESGRTGGLAGYRSGELLALILAGRLVASRLASLAGERSEYQADQFGRSTENAAPATGSDSPGPLPTSAVSSPVDHEEPVPVA